MGMDVVLDDDVEEPRMKKVRFNLPDENGDDGDGKNEKAEKPKDIMSSLSELVDDMNQNKDLLFDGSKKDIVLKEQEVAIDVNEDDENRGDGKGKEDVQNHENAEDDNFD